MKVLLSITMLLASACATDHSIKVGSSRHDIVYSIDLEDTFTLLEDICASKLGEEATEAEVASCVAETVNELFAAMDEDKKAK